MFADMIAEWESAVIKDLTSKAQALRARIERQGEERDLTDDLRLEVMERVLDRLTSPPTGCKAPNPIDDSARR